MSESEEKNVAALLEVVGEIGVPEPVQKGFLKAAVRLIGAAIDIPAAYLEGFASDYRASTDARRKLLLEAANKMASEFGSSSDLANRAYIQQASRILRSQVIMEDVVGRAAEELASDEKSDDPSGAPSDDWLEAFRAEAGNRSKADIHTAFSRILAGEIRRPGSFSIRTVRAVGQMEQLTARIFQDYANICIVAEGGLDVRVPSLGGNANQNRLTAFGLDYINLNILQENGLVQPNYHSYMDYAVAAKLGLPFKYAGRQMILSLKNPDSPAVLVNGPALSTVGRELLGITVPTENKNYTGDLLAYLDGAGFNVRV